MADIRIKDLTTTASTTASDDFFAADGATNGTRKLSAYSPSFGGNATVGGTLTVTGVVTAGNAVNASGIIGTTAVSQRITNTSGAFQIYKDATPSLAARFSLNTAASDIAAIGVYNGSSWTDPLQINTTQVLVTTTTASTSSSSGALVVGNGTSGGLGVGGAIHLGDNLNLNSASGQIVVSGTGNTANSKELRFYRSDGGDWSVFGLTGSAYAGSLTGLGNSEAFIYNANPLRVFIGTAATNRFDFTASQFKINATTASTGTSSGALVVSGGVGVAGDVYAGGTTGFKLGSSSGAYRFSAGAYVDAESSSTIRLLDSTGNFATVKTGSLIASTPGTAPSLTVNSTMTFELTSNTTLKVFVRGTDGTTRSVSLTLV